MFEHKKVFTVDPDLYKLEETFRSQRIDDTVKRFNIIESFIKSSEAVEEVIQLLSFSEIGSIERKADFFKTVFNVDGENFEQVTDRIQIPEEEYYDKLLGAPPDIVERKIRVQFDFRDAEYTLDFIPNHSFAIVEIKYFDESEDVDWDLFGFGSLTLENEINMSLDETSYRRFVNSEK